MTKKKKKNGSLDVTFTGRITHQKHLAQSGCSKPSAVDIFNTLRVFTKQPIREQEIKLECMNESYFCNHSDLDIRSKIATSSTHYVHGSTAPVGSPKKGGSPAVKTPFSHLSCRSLDLHLQQHSVL